MVGFTHSNRVPQAPQLNSLPSLRLVPGKAHVPLLPPFGAPAVFHVPVLRRHPRCSVGRLHSVAREEHAVAGVPSAVARPSVDATLVLLELQEASVHPHAQGLRSSREIGYLRAEFYGGLVGAVPALGDSSSPKSITI